MKYLIIGDIHGHIDFLEDALDYAENNNMTMVQLGDITDSFDRTMNEGKECLRLAVRACEDHIFLRGNHDLSYENPRLYRCSGWTRQKQREYEALYSHIKFQDYFYTDNVLVTHAGLSHNHIKLWSYFPYKSHPFEEFEPILKEQLKDPKSPIYKAGRVNGGPLPVGGMFWCRPQYMSNPFSRTQIFGHTRCDTATENKKENFWRIDTIEYGDQSVLVTEGSLIRKIQIR